MREHIFREKKNIKIRVLITINHTIYILQILLDRQTIVGMIIRNNANYYCNHCNQIAHCIEHLRVLHMQDATLYSQMKIGDV